jgi:hypothetical protein
MEHKFKIPSIKIYSTVISKLDNIFFIASSLEEGKRFSKVVLDLKLLQGTFTFLR